MGYSVCGCFLRPQKIGLQERTMDLTTLILQAGPLATFHRELSC